MVATLAGASFGSSYGRWSRDTANWADRQRDSLKRLPLWAQVVDDDGESISDGSLQLARLMRLRSAIVAADEAEFLARGLDRTRAAAFLEELAASTDAKTSAGVIPDAMVLRSALAALEGRSLESVRRVLAATGPAARVDLARRLRAASTGRVNTVEDRPLSPEEVEEACMLAAVSDAVASTLNAVLADAVDVVEGKAEADAVGIVDVDGSDASFAAVIDAMRAGATAAVGDDFVPTDAAYQRDAIVTAVETAVHAAAASGVIVPGLSAARLGKLAGGFADSLLASAARLRGIASPDRFPALAAEAMVEVKSHVVAAAQSRLDRTRQLGQDAAAAAKEAGDDAEAARVERATAEAIAALESRTTDDELERTTAASFAVMRSRLTRAAPDGAVPVVEFADPSVLAGAVTAWLRRWTPAAAAERA